VFDKPASESDGSAGEPAETAETAGQPGEGVLSPEALLETLAHQANEAAIFPGSLREEYLFAYDLLLDQSTVGRFIKGPLAPRVVQLTNHRLVWPYYYPPAGTALPSLLRTNRDDDAVWGVIYETKRKDVRALEEYLRVPNRYHRRAVAVHDRGGRRIMAFAYVLSVQDPLPGKPSADFRGKLAAAAAERSLPEEWLSALNSLETGEYQSNTAP
jgi:hypothetical protein